MDPVLPLVICNGPEPLLLLVNVGRLLRIECPPSCPACAMEISGRQNAKKTSPLASKFFTVLILESISDYIFGDFTVVSQFIILLNDFPYRSL